jgi:hypothetical protein
MSDKRQKNQLVLAFREEKRGEARSPSQEGTEALTAKRRAESPAMGKRLMEEVCERETASRPWHESRPIKGVREWMA